MALVRTDGPGLLIDLGLGPKMIMSRLEATGASGYPISAALITHTHADHVDEGALRWLFSQSIPLYCHGEHGKKLRNMEGFQQLEQVGLVRHYQEDRPWLAPNGMQIESIPLSHDDHPTFGFRIEAPGRARMRKVRSLGYVADTGTWTDQTVEALRDIDVLGVEFNHDLGLQRNSTRPAFLISRILGKRGHLSNDQGSDLIEAVVKRSSKRELKAVVLLHLSQDCNHPELARSAAAAALRRSGQKANVLVALQETPVDFSATVSIPRVKRADSQARSMRHAGDVREGRPWQTFF